ncbi:MAG: anthranilate synthase component I family protein [Methanomicrobiales archaeon]|nr:anthranilate synthase component I family protein [Methanomicrobiales archaeon]
MYYHVRPTISEGDAGGMDNAMKACNDTEITSFEQYKKIADTIQGPAYIPITMEIPMPLADPATIYATMAESQGFLLESIEGIPKRAVRSIIGINPVAVLAFSDALKITGDLSDFFQTIEKKLIKNKSALEILKQVCNSITGHIPDNFSFSGGMAGYCKYDLVNEITQGMVQAGIEGGPVFRFIVPGDLIIFDHIRNSCTLVAGTFVNPKDNFQNFYENAVLRLKKLKAITGIEPVRFEYPKMPENITLLPGFDRDEYEGSVCQALEYIRAGDIFQVVLSRRFTLDYPGDPFRIYQVLRSINPSPYLYYINFGDEAIIGSSPEMLVKTEGSDITTVPIAGTRPRGKTIKEDEELAQELLDDPKECAEHLMLVDLARNDIGRVSEFGTVRVSEFMTVEKFSHVQHITSVVNGDMQKGLHPVDALKACFPAGTVSGAPKIRAMQIIEELEPVSRGLYSGAVGYLSFDNRMEFAIAIRTIIVKDGVATCQAGAGIVADSVPSREFDETQAKVSAMAQAVFCAGGQA